MTAARKTSRPRGLTLLELLLAVAITGMVAAAITSMLGAVSTGAETRRDTRSLMIQSAAAQMRLGAYIAPARCFLARRDADLAIWFDDSRESETVHASEVRWLVHTPAAGTIDVCFVRFPEDWSDTSRKLEDAEYPLNTDWFGVLALYAGKGLIGRYTLVDGLESASLTLRGTATNAVNATYRLEYGEGETLISAAILSHAVPVW
jgi:prepilin-type N-terminal cleavage/methylation domain-containing protein